jgi:hypothetical protein
MDLLRLNVVDHQDLLRKAYRVGPYLLAGFAGSVNIGFQLIGDLQNFLLPPDNSRSAWKPEWVAEHCTPRLREFLRKHRPRSKRDILNC